MKNRERLQFTGQGGEYFKIWIVNLLLSILTLGMYSAWAKVRRNQYFYRHTRLAGACFDYHGDPKAILKGRMIAVVLVAAYTLAGTFSPHIALAILLAILLLMPWLLKRSLRFRLYNSSYRGLRFAFYGKTGGAYLNWLAWPLASALSLGVLWPLTQQRIVRYMRDNSAYGNALFRFAAGTGGFYKIYLLVIPMLVAIFVLLLVASQLVIPDHVEQRMAVGGALAGIGTYLGLLIFGYPYVSARMQNLIWNHTQLAGVHRFASDIKASGLFGIMFSNLLLTLLTLGLYKPFGDIRLARYRIEHISLIPGADLENIVAGIESQAAAAGEEIAEMFDLDISL